MITGAHFLLFSKDADADRQFILDKLGLRGVDAGGGWLIFALPPAELGVHPSDENLLQRHADHQVFGAAFYLMCDDIQATIKSLSDKGVATTEVAVEEWGIRTTIKLPSGGAIGLYQPKHPTAV